ncbi:P-loop containing nucleoside triphosphate hydrolase protein [Pluteus cervinus]|uniref:P-loop containing nucleoside triphosphate hydrolase protein n=1 Tax=Pluteus cervinus TaxID=181527 RepID=A0ACD3AV89_9AGAR|nr:P-loop containing nucleoside triphosphate hydrolase protein [Pluteus cervinus]
MSLFWRQFVALTWKNWIGLSKHPWVNIIRCFLLPVGYGVFLAVAQIFLARPNDYGIGEPVPVFSLSSQFDGSLALVWADGTSGTSNPTPDAIMSHITAGFSQNQLNAVQKVASPADIITSCPQNFNGFSECFGAVAFNDIPTDPTRPINYTIRADGGLFFIDVIHHKSDFEKRILPLQWAVDQAIIELRTGQQVPTPLEWPFTIETNEQQATDTRLSYIRGLRSLLVLALFICYIGISYQLPGVIATERATLLTSHMKAMGLLDSARIVSWHISLSLAYLPAWVIVGLTWHFRIFTKTNAGLVLVVHLLLGFVLASWSFLISAPFGKSPQLAAVATTFFSVFFAIVALVLSSHAGTGAAFIFSILFPPGFYIFAIRAICGWENHLLPTNALKGDPDSGLRLLPIMLAAIISTFLWPWVAIRLERKLYEVAKPSSGGFFSCFGRKKKTEIRQIPDNVAISIRNLKKVFSTSSAFFLKKDKVTAVSDLSLDIPKNGIYVLLGSNGAGKSTTLSILAGLIGRTSGSIVFEGNIEYPDRGTVGIVPQKNVLFPDLTCLQTLRVWRAVKWSDRSMDDEDLVQLLKDCDLGTKINSNAHVLSGGQKRKLQLAIGLVGGSRIVLVDECTSGVDPLSRRALWRTLTAFRQDRTIVFTTHFLDEADLLADNIAILAAPGKLVADGTPVALKRDLGEGYIIQMAFTVSETKEKLWEGPPIDLLTDIQAYAADAYSSSSAPYFASYHLKTRDPAVVEQVLALLDRNKGRYHVGSYDILGTTIEDIFLELMARNEAANEQEKAGSGTTDSSQVDFSGDFTLVTGRPISPLRQMMTIFYKRMLIARRSWLTPLLMVLVAIAASTIPKFYIEGQNPVCGRVFKNVTAVPLFLPTSPIGLLDASPDASSSILVSPPGILSTIGVTNSFFFQSKNVTNNATFVSDIQQNFQNLSLGGVSIDPNTGDSLIAWEATPPGMNGPAILNLASNLLFNRALSAAGGAGAAAGPVLIEPDFQPFPPISAANIVSLRWTAFFCAAMSVYPAFYALYVSRERRSSVQAMQMSNGLTNPLGLWLGHLAFDSVFAVIISTIVIVVLAGTTSEFHGLGFFWLVMVLYGITGALFAYCASLITTSPLAAFAIVAAYQWIMFILYIAAYLLVLTYAKTSDASSLITTLHFTLSIVSPVASVTRASLISLNLFSLLCVGTNSGEDVSTSSMGTILRYGGPIVYLIVYSAILLGILVWVDSGSILPRKFLKPKQGNNLELANLDGSAGGKVDVLQEAKAVANSEDLLKILHVSKAYGGKRVVDDVTLGVGKDTIFALLGPNGAGKTTTFNLIRGDTLPNSGDVFINAVSVIRNPRIARHSLGVCPQFNAIDSQLTVREHLVVYGRLKGLRPGEELNSSVNSVLQATNLHIYADRLASKLSGGNQRKLSLAIALIGNPPVLLIDEFSTGIDAKMKRDMWKTLRHVAKGKAVIITTHSMEEASALANKVGILARRLLAIGTTASLSSRYATYEVHFTCRTREEIASAQALMARIPGSRMADDVATRFEVPIDENQHGLAQLFGLLSRHGEFAEYTVEKATLESVFIKVIRENNVSEEDAERGRT